MFQTLTFEEAECKMRTSVDAHEGASEVMHTVPDDEVYATFLAIARRELCHLKEDLEETDCGTGWRGNKIWFSDWTVTEESDGRLTAVVITEDGSRTVDDPFPLQDARMVGSEIDNGLHGCNAGLYQPHTVYVKKFLPSTHVHGPCEHGTVHT